MLTKMLISGFLRLQASSEYSRIHANNCAQRNYDPNRRTEAMIDKRPLVIDLLYNSWGRAISDAVLLKNAGRGGSGAAKNIVEEGYPLAILAHRNWVPVDDLGSRGAVEVASTPDLVAQERPRISWRRSR